MQLLVSLLSEDQQQNDVQEENITTEHVSNVEATMPEKNHIPEPHIQPVNEMIADNNLQLNMLDDEGHDEKTRISYQGEEIQTDELAKDSDEDVEHAREHLRLGISCT